jgi:chemotaxis protein CheC
VTEPVSIREHDALIEIFNIGVGAAASTLSEMVGEEVSLNLPSLELLRGGDSGRRRDLAASRICAIEQRFQSIFGQGRVMLTFPELKSLQLISVLVGEQANLERVTDLEREALTEVGNIILNSCMATLSDMVGQEIETSIPSFRLAEQLTDLMDEAGNSEDAALLLTIQFNMKNRAIEGRLIFFLELEQLHRLVAEVARATLGGVAS